jgi:hypothetical protein
MEASDLVFIGVYERPLVALVGLPRTAQAQPV